MRDLTTNKSKQKWETETETDNEIGEILLYLEHFFKNYCK